MPLAIEDGPVVDDDGLDHVDDDGMAAADHVDGLALDHIDGSDDVDGFDWIFDSMALDHVGGLCHDHSPGGSSSPTRTGISASSIDGDQTPPRPEVPASRSPGVPSTESRPEVPASQSSSEADGCAMS